MSHISIRISDLQASSETWPRDVLNQDRVDLFAGLLQEGQELPPIEVVPTEGGKYLIADGIHRCLAAAACHRTEVEVVIVTREEGESPEACAFRRALETASRTALPLTRHERRRAALKLLAERPDTSRRQVARLVGVSHDSVNRWAAVDDSSTPSDVGGTARPRPTAPEVAVRLARYVGQLQDGRGLLDSLIPARMGQHLARALRDQFGEEAITEAKRLSGWIHGAIAVLEGLGQ
jgi:hypothetical protein